MSSVRGPVVGGVRGMFPRIIGSVSYFVERVVPDPFIFAVLLTILAGLMAHIIGSRAPFSLIGAAWYNGVFNILSFAFQMLLILVTGYALASSRPIQALLEKAASIPKNSRDAVSLTVLISMSACWLNWGFGLVTAGLLARSIASKIRLDFGWLVAAAYTGFLVTPEGPSGSIALSQATSGSTLNLVERLTGHGLSLGQTIFAPFTFIPVLSLFILLPIAFRYTEPAGDSATIVSRERLAIDRVSDLRGGRTGSIASRLEEAWIVTACLVVFAAMSLVSHWKTTHVFFDINSVILIFLILGLAFHVRPSAYCAAVKDAARISGPLILQYPLYGGIMGVMTSTGLAAAISLGFLKFASPHTLPFWTYISSLIITFFIPSGGGHWAVQGPFVLPAAIGLHVSVARTTMAVAMGESVGNMMQPFFALPVLAIADIGMRRMLGFMLSTFLIALLAFGISLLW
jgi:short-chain fatty acids transporter